MASTLHPPRCTPKGGASTTTVVTMRTVALYVASRHCLQPLFHRQLSRTVLGAQPLLIWSGRQARSCLACSMLKIDAPGSSEDPAPPVRLALACLCSGWKLARCSRYTGVWCRKGQKKYTASIHFQGRNRYLGSYATPGEAACVYDEACIVLKRDPVNFPRSRYDEAAILQFSDFETFARTKRTPRDTSSRFCGVSRAHGGRYGKWASYHAIMGQRQHLGDYSTEELAAQAYDKVCIYQGLRAKNFPDASYDVESIYQQESIGSLVASIRAEAAEPTRAKFTSRYTGVYLTASGIYEAFSSTFSCLLGRYSDEAQAAMAYDHFCIYQGRAPTNFPDHPYDRQQICRPADLSEFVHQSRESSARETKLRQSSRYSGVSWDKRTNKWAAYVRQGRRKVHLGLFESEMEAARLVDTHRQKLGKETVNFPLKSRTTAVDKTWSGHLRKQTTT